jgi:hypothetical protein
MELTLPITVPGVDVDDRESAPCGEAEDDILMIFIVSAASASKVGQAIFQFSPDTAGLEDGDRFQPWLARMTDYPSMWTRVNKMRAQGLLEDFKSRRRKVTFFVSEAARKCFSQIIQKEYARMLAIPPCPASVLSSRLKEVYNSYTQFRTNIAMDFYDKSRNQGR